MATRTESHAWRPILRLLVPAAVLGTTLGLWQAGVFDGRILSSSADAEDAREATVMPRVSSRARQAPTMTVTEDRSPDVQLAAPDVHTPADVDELAEEAALQQAMAEEQSNGD